MASIVQVFWRAAKADRLVTITLVLHWGWSALFYHLAFFRQINPAATAFAVMFLAQAALLTWRGIARSSMSYDARPSAWRALSGWALIVYAMLYPLVGLAFGLRYPRMPIVGVPCPTTILTAGFLLFGSRREARILGWVPLIWAAIGGSAAFLLGIRADLALPVAGLIILAYMSTPDRRSR